MAIVNITAENDADFYRSFAYQTASGLPIDLTGTSMLMKVRKHATDIQAVLELSTDTGELVYTDPPSSGFFTVFIAQGELVRLPIGDYDQSLILLVNSLRKRVWSGVLTVTAGPSR
jgi:hypothetical protein